MSARYYRGDGAITIEIDVADYLDVVTTQELDDGETPLIVEDMKDARRCLLRPQPSAAEALCYLERALVKMAKQGFS